MVRLRGCRRGALPDGGAAGVKAVELPEGVKGWADGRLASFLANTAGVAEPCRVSVRYADGEEDEIQQTRAGWRILKGLEDDDVILVGATGAARAPSGAPATITDSGGGDMSEELGEVLPPGKQLQSGQTTAVGADGPTYKIDKVNALFAAVICIMFNSL